MNAYESGIQKNIPAVLVYVFSRFNDGIDRVLMIHRNAGDRPGDIHAGKWNGLGGKCEPQESFGETAVRELREESGLNLTDDSFSFAGLLQFPNFKPHRNEDWTCAVFRAEISAARAAEVPPQTAEGSLHWIKITELSERNLWEGDREFLPYVLKKQPFMGTIWYLDGKVARSIVAPIPPSAR